MRKMVFVTGNKGKFNEARSILEAKDIELIQDTGGYPELQEDELEPIASFGAKWAAEKLKIPVMVDDSGLFINALNGFPGPYSAFVENKIGNKKVLRLMEDEDDRTAVFKSVIGYCEPAKEAIVFTGMVKGLISLVVSGMIPYLSIMAGLLQRSVMTKRTSFLTGAGHWISSSSGFLSKGDIF